MKAMDMRKRIDLELRGKDRRTIKELNLDSCRGQQIDGLNDEFENLEVLSLINVGLTTLKGFPKLPKLRKLELSDNRMCNGLDNLISCKSLTHLNLSGNKIKEVEELAPLANLTNLRNLDLFNCEVTKTDSYREKIFKLLPSLKFLDGFDQNEQEDDEDDEYGGDSDISGEDDDDEENDDEVDDDEDEEEETEAVSSKKSQSKSSGGKYANGVPVAENGGVVNEEDEDDEDDEDDDDFDDEDDEDDDGAEGPGLRYLEKEDLADEDDDGDYDEEDDDHDDEDDDLGEEDSNRDEDSNLAGRPAKRKHEDTDDTDSKNE